MNSAALESVGWKMTRWLFLLAFVFGAQLLLIYLLSMRSPVAHSISASPASIQLFDTPLSETEFSKIFLASDPTLFATANPHGFSGAAWLKVPQRNYELSEQVEAPFWLPINSNQLGNVMGRFVNTNEIALFRAPENAAPKIFASSILDLPDNARTNSQLRIEGELAARQLLTAPQLQSWSANEILSNTVVQISVDKNGLVLSPRLLSRSGSLEADQNALALSRNLRFAPEAQPGLTWGKLIFEWHTVPVATTNSATGNSK